MKKHIKQHHAIKHILMVKLEGESTDIAAFINGSQMPLDGSQDVVRVANFLGKVSGVIPATLTHTVTAGWCWDHVANELVSAGKLKKVNADGFFPV